VNKLTHSARAFAQRVEMGASRIWLLVEGRNNDGPFYDRLLESVLEPNTPYSIRAVEQIELNGSSAGGKPFALALYTFFASEGMLVQEASDGHKAIAFALDRDYDDFNQTLVASDHITYSLATDIETDILMNGNIVSATSSTYSIPRSEVTKALPAHRHVVDELAIRWKEWITLRMLSCCLGALPGVQHAAKSSVNEGLFGQVVPDKVRDLKDQMANACPDFNTKAPEIEGVVNLLYLSSQQASLVKGKWVESFVHHLISTGTSTYPRPANVQAASLTRACIETLDFNAPWTDGYKQQLTPILTLVA
jgi:hypothetical protein